MKDSILNHFKICSSVAMKDARSTVQSSPAPVSPEFLSPCRTETSHPPSCSSGLLFPAPAPTISLPVPGNLLMPGTAPK